jgi:hypothetical protein
MRTAGGTEAEGGSGRGGGGGDGEGSGADGGSGGAREFAISAHDPQQVPCALPRKGTLAQARILSHPLFSPAHTHTISPTVSRLYEHDLCLLSLSVFWPDCVPACLHYPLPCLPVFFQMTQVPLSSVMRQLKKMGWGQARLQRVRTAMGKKRRPGERDSGGQVGEYGFFKVILHTYIFESQARKERGGFFFPDEERLVPA